MTTTHSDEARDDLKAATLLAFIEWLHKNQWRLIGSGGGADKRKWLVERFLQEQTK